MARSVLLRESSFGVGFAGSAWEALDGAVNRLSRVSRVYTLRRYESSDMIPHLCFHVNAAFTVCVQGKD